ncbi:hypothetical protein [Mucilaginibacter defluvii]
MSLGISLVEELKLNKSVDTLGRWMAHYVAEKIVAAEKATGPDAKEIQLECSQAILGLWDHRWKMQQEYRPLRDFDRLLDLLQQIDPETSEPNYFKLDAKAVGKENEQWLTAAGAIDRATRVCLKYTLEKAAEATLDDVNRSLIQDASVIGPDPDIAVIQQLLRRKKYDLEPDDPKIGPELKDDLGNASIRNYIDHLDQLTKQAAEIRSLLEKEINDQGKGYVPGK